MEKNIVGIFMKNVNIYEGEFPDNIFHGYEIYYYNNKNYFLGLLINNEKTVSES